MEFQAFVFAKFAGFPCKRENTVMYLQDNPVRENIGCGQPLTIAIGSLTTEQKASYSLVFSDIKYRQNIAGR
jgi:hypothetical protein